MNKLNARILAAIACLTKMSACCQTLIEDQSEASAAAMAQCVNEFSQHSDAVLACVDTLLKLIDGDDAVVKKA